MDSIRTLGTILRFCFFFGLFLVFACWAQESGASGKVQAIGLFVFLTCMFSTGGKKKK